MIINNLDCENGVNTNPQDILLLKSALGEALINRLQTGTTISEITIHHLALEVEIEPDVASAIVADPYELFLHWFDTQVSQILVGLVEDFSEDSNASTQEKILEALMTMLEAFASKRDILKSIHGWALKEPKFGIELAQIAYQICDRILTISGDTHQDMLVARFQRSLRIKGLIGLLVGIRSVWFQDMSDDLAPTFRELDKLLQQASEWGQSLRLFDGPAAGENTDLK